MANCVLSRSSAPRTRQAAVAAALAYIDEQFYLVRPLRAHADFIVRHAVTRAQFALSRWRVQITSGAAPDTIAIAARIAAASLSLVHAALVAVDSVRPS